MADVRVFVVRLSGRGGVGEQRLQLGDVLAGELQEGLEVAQRRRDVAEQRGELAQHAFERRQALLGGACERAEVGEQVVEVGRERLHPFQQRRQLALPRLRLFEHGARHRGEVVEFAQRRRRAALEGRQQAEGVGPLGAARAERVEGALAVDDEPAELVVAFGERVEQHAGVVHDRGHRAFLGGEDRDQLVGVFRERFELGDVRVDLFSAPVDGGGQRLLPDFERSACLGVERVEDVVERHRRIDLGGWQLPAVGDWMTAHRVRVLEPSTPGG